MDPGTRRIPQLGDTPRRAALLGAKLAAALLLVAALGGLGLWDVIDGLLERQYYALRGARASQQSVVLVGVDAETVTRWGAPPYSHATLAPLFASIAAGGPALTAVVEPGRRLVRDAEPTPEIAAAVFARRLLIPAPAGGSAAPSLAVGPGGAIDAVRLRGALTQEILERTGLAGRDPDLLPVNFVGPGGNGLPLVSAARVAAGAIPGGTFAGKIVLVGVTDRGVAGEVVTPVGALTPAEVHAHAILGLTDGVAWRRTSAWARWLLLVLTCLAVLALVPQIDETRALAGAAGAALLFLLADYLLFARGVVRWGASATVFAIGASALISGWVERRRIRGALGDVGREIRLRSGLESLAGDARADDSHFWLRVAELARLYLDCKSSIVAELPPDRWHLSLRVITGASLDQIQEKRRDIRRGPYRRAHLSLNPVWQDDFMSARRGEKTLLVPLVVSTRLLGFWILNFPVEVTLEPGQLKLAAALARQVSLAVERRQAAAADLESERSLLERLLGDGRLGAELEHMGGAVRRLAHDKRGLATLIDGLPFGVLVGTLWGEVRYANAAMRALAAEEGAERLQACSVGEVLMALTGMGKDEVGAELRRLVREQPELSLAGRPEPGGRRVKHQIVLSWLARDERKGGPAGDDGEQLLLLTALPSRVAARSRARVADFGDERTTGVRLASAGVPAAVAGEITGEVISSAPSLPEEPAGPGSATERVPLEEAMAEVLDKLRQVDDTTAHLKLKVDPEIEV